MRKPQAVIAESDSVVERLEALLTRKARQSTDEWTFALQVVAPDGANPHDPRRSAAKALEEHLSEHLVGTAGWSDRARSSDQATELLQTWVVDEHRAFLGLTPSAIALSHAPGGRLRLERPADAPSRSGLKLEEAIEWCGTGPEKGDLVADLGAAPGGWTQVALDRGATVIAVDLAKVKVTAKTKRFEHLEENAFRYAPPEMIDWVLCDMAYRPLEVAQLLAKWARRSWARQLLANIKLPMKKKVEVLRKVLSILEDGGWTGLRARQLYHDRDEVTVFGWLNPAAAHRSTRAPFGREPRKRKPRPRRRR